MSDRRSKNTNEVLVVESVASLYGGDVAGLQDVSLRVPRGEILAVVGANGAGKTTTLRAIANLLPALRGRIVHGRILFNGQDTARLSCDALVRAGIATVLEGRHCFASLTLEENLKTGALAKGLSRADTRRDLERLYALFPALAERRSLLASQVSGGEQQMTAVGRALMARPALLLLDEPSMGLAPLIVRTIFEALISLNKDDGLSVVLAEQNLAVARRYAHRFLALSAGRTVPLATDEHSAFADVVFGRPRAMAS